MEVVVINTPQHNEVAVATDIVVVATTGVLVDAVAKSGALAGPVVIEVVLIGAVAVVARGAGVVVLVVSVTAVLVLMVPWRSSEVVIKLPAGKSGLVRGVKTGVVVI
jgi:hypothetical protein